MFPGSLVFEIHSCLCFVGFSLLGGSQQGRVSVEGWSVKWNTDWLRVQQTARGNRTTPLEQRSQEDGDAEGWTTVMQAGLGKSLDYCDMLILVYGTKYALIIQSTANQISFKLLQMYSWKKRWYHWGLFFLTDQVLLMVPVLCQFSNCSLHVHCRKAVPS